MRTSKRGITQTLYSHHQGITKTSTRRLVSPSQNLSITLSLLRCNPSWTQPNWCPGLTLGRLTGKVLRLTRAKVGKTGNNMLKWGYAANVECPGGAETQTMEHIMTSCPWGPSCTDDDLRFVNDIALRWLEGWCSKIWFDLSHKCKKEESLVIFDLESFTFTHPTGFFDRQDSFLFSKFSRFLERFYKHGWLK